MHYKDFELELGTAEGEGVYAVRVESPYMDPVEATFEMPYDDLEFEGVKRDLELAVLKGSGTRRSLVPEQTDKVKLFGETMFNAIFTGDVAESYKDALRRAKEERMGLRIRLTTKAPELGAIAWEFLRDPGESWLVLDQATPIVRHMRKLGDEDLLEVEGPLRILGMIASPQDMPQLDVEKEKARMEEALHVLREAGLVEIVWTDGGTWRHLQDAMRHGPWHVLHFIGHGGFDPSKRLSVLAFEREGGGNYKPIEPEQLARLVKADQDLRLVVLNACEGAKGDEANALSSTAAYLVRNAAPAVLAMQWEISDKAAKEFSRTFYNAVADGLPVDAAVADARVALSMHENSLEWATPVLFMRSQDGVLFDVKVSAHPPHASDTSAETEAAAGAVAPAEGGTDAPADEAAPGATRTSQPVAEETGIEPAPARDPEPVPAAAQVTPLAATTPAPAPPTVVAPPPASSGKVRNMLIGAGVGIAAIVALSVLFFGDETDDPADEAVAPIVATTLAPAATTPATVAPTTIAPVDPATVLGTTIDDGTSVTAAAIAAGTHALVTDDTGQVRVAIPTTWQSATVPRSTAVGTIPQIQAAPDLAAYETDFGAPGITVGLVPSTDDIEETFSAIVTNFYAGCIFLPTQPWTAPAGTGIAAVFTGCFEDPGVTGLLALVAVPGNDESYIVLAAQAAERMDETTQVVVVESYGAAATTSADVATTTIGELTWTVASVPPGFVTWQQAAAYCTQLVVDGEAFRLPALTELASIADPNAPNPAGYFIRSEFHAGLFVDWIWSSDLNGTSEAFVYDFEFLEPFSLSLGATDEAQALCVSG